MVESIMMEPDALKEEKRPLVEAQGRFKQVKVSVDENLADAFKKACRASEVSMAEVLSQFMFRYTASKPGKKRAPDYSTKRQRRKALSAVIEILEQIKQHEESYRDKIPENLQGSAHHENAEEFVTLLEEAIDILSKVP